MTQALRIEQHQQQQRDHRLFPVRVVARYWGHGGYVWAALADDGELLCARCVRANYAQIVRSTLREDGDGWQIVGHANSGELEDGERCAHCYQAIA